VATVFTALSGYTHLTGYEGGGPGLISDIYGDPSSGGAMVFAVLAALYERDQSGEGQLIDFSHVDNLASYLAPACMDWLQTGRELHRLGNADTAISPHGVYRCRDSALEAAQGGPWQAGPNSATRDGQGAKALPIGRNGAPQVSNEGWIAISAPRDAEWRALAQTLGLEACLADERFADAYRRLKNRAVLDELINTATAEHEAHALAADLQHAGVTANPVWSWEEIANGEQLQARGMLNVLEHSLIGPVFALGPPWLTSDLSLALHTAGPLLGAHNDYILRDVLCLPQAEIDELKRQGIVE
jgi:crotonobetainyl-CoA:carnitine CoA-transferase CaiB-like acyl-CoA transferase